MVCLLVPIGQRALELPGCPAGDGRCITDRAAGAVPTLHASWRVAGSGRRRSTDQRDVDGPAWNIPTPSQRPRTADARVFGEPGRRRGEPGTIRHGSVGRVAEGVGCPPG